MAGDGIAGVRETADLVARRSYGKLVALLSARTRDVAAAEDALAEAFAAALAEWPKSGCPVNPEGWLLTVARRKAVDAHRRTATADAAAGHLKLLAEEAEAMQEDAIPDRRLALLFAVAHPAIDPAARSPLMLQVVLGIDAPRIASAFLTSPSAMEKRLVRAKTRIRDAGIAFAVPAPDELSGRLGAVLDAIYAAYGRGWSDAGAADGRGRDLGGEALFLADLVAATLPGEAEALGLLALMLHTAARQEARRDDQGRYVPLSQQDAHRWDTAMIARAEAVLADAARLGRIGRYQLEAAIQSAHVARLRFGSDTRADILRLYDALAAVAPSPVAAVNRALAVADVDGAEAGLAALPDPAADPRLVAYQPYWAAKAELSARNGDTAEADEAYGLAIGLETDPAVRRFLIARRAGL